MTKRPENPPAFPENTFQKVDDVAVGECKSGMTLRDYFAASALQGYIAHPGEQSTIAGGKDEYQLMAEFAYKWADAMLKARQS